MQISFCSTAARWHHRWSARRAKSDLYHGSVRGNKRHGLFYAGGISFSTWRSTDKMSKEGTQMRTRISVAALLVCAVGAVAVSIVGAPQAQAPRDPQVIDVQGYQKLMQQYRGKPLLINFWAT